MLLRRVSWRDTRVVRHDDTTLATLHRKEVLQPRTSSQASKLSYLDCTPEGGAC